MMPEERSLTQQEAEQLLRQMLAASLAEVLETMAGERPEIEITDPEQDTETGAAEQTGDSWWEQYLDLGDDARVWIGAPETTSTVLGRRTLAMAGVAEPEAGDIRGTYRELLQQVLSTFSQSLGTKLGREVSCTEGQETSMTPPHLGFVLTLRYSNGETLVVPAAFSPALVGALSADPEEESPTSTQQPAAETSSDSATASGTIELLLDVELPVSISFGRAHLPLKDVLKLTSGSIVELNRSVSEPVEVIVNNCVIARGEVVVVEGNYGVRINQIISRRERLRTLN